MGATKLTKNDIEIANRIRRLRKKKELTQEQLAEKVRVSTTHIGLVETGKRRASLKTLQRIASALGVKLKDLF
ncbi:MAG TPA: helix-turn-helix transcriptional regulator [Patescibacteria group bacterium]|nr:helix-turn-helix transcriptional regulator [Patescibacteria group bacterium]